MVFVGFVGESEPHSGGTGCRSANVESERSQENRVLDRRFAAHPQLSETHLMFEPGHGGFDAGPPAISVLKLIGLLG